MIPRAALRALTAPGADRPAVLEAMLRRSGVTAVRAALAGSTHLVVRFEDSEYDRRYRTKLLVAHHDRVPGSPGALDNAAACLQLAALAERLASRTAARGNPHNTVMLFTDSEESTTAGGQGSFPVARVLAGRVRSLAGEAGEIGEPPTVFVFDVTGRGDTALLSSTALDLLEERGLGESDLAADIRTLGSWAGRALRKGMGRAPLTLPVPWSDDLGFALGGVPALTVTLLPRSEAESYRNDVADARTEGDGKIRPGGYPSAKPYSWKKLHGPEDDESLLEDSSFDLMEHVLDAFAELRIPKVRRIR